MESWLDSTVKPREAILETMKQLTVNALWDDEAQVWVASSEDVPGLSTEASTLELLTQKLTVMIPELLENLPSDAFIHLEAHRDLQLVA